MKPMNNVYEVELNGPYRGGMVIVIAASESDVVILIRNAFGGYTQGDLEISRNDGLQVSADYDYPHVMSSAFYNE